MSDTVLTQSKQKTRADYKADAAQLLAEMDRLDEQMDQSHLESERLKGETQAIKAQTEATLSWLREQVSATRLN